MPLIFSLILATSLADQPVLDVYLPHFNDRQANRSFGRARAIVDAAYAEIGLRVTWHFTASLPPDCVKGPMRRQIVFELLTGPATGRSATALAAAKPYSQQGPCITLLMDRFQASAEQNPETTGMLMGHVIAHEIGHVLQGVDRHSETGLMKERWSAQEIKEMWRTRLRFTPYDAELILASFGNDLPVTLSAVK